MLNKYFLRSVSQRGSGANNNKNKNTFASVGGLVRLLSLSPGFRARVCPKDKIRRITPILLGFKSLGVLSSPSGGRREVSPRALSQRALFGVIIIIAAAAEIVAICERHAHIIIIVIVHWAYYHLQGDIIIFIAFIVLYLLFSSGIRSM